MGYVGETNKEGEREGDGIMTYPDGSVYDGQWYYDSHHGWGMLRSKLGYYYGEWFFGSKVGKGKFAMANGDVYEGIFRFDVPYGKGRTELSNGDIYEGDYKNGAYDGKGIMTYVNGDIHEGTWKSGKKNGKGTFTSGSEDGTDIYKGQWKNDILTWWSDKSCNGIEDPVSYESIPDDRGFRLQAEKVKDENGHYNKGRCYDAETISKIKNNVGPFSRKKFTNIDKMRREGYEEYVKRKNKKKDFPSYRPSPSAKSAPNMSTRSKRTNSARIFSRPSSANIFSKSKSARRSAKSLGGRRRRRSSTRVIQ